MNRRNIALVLMLSAGAVTCVVNIIRRYALLHQLIILFVVLVLFYGLGCLIQWTLDFFDEQNEKRLAAEGEVIEKESELDLDLGMEDAFDHPEQL